MCKHQASQNTTAPSVPCQVYVRTSEEVPTTTQRQADSSAVQVQTTGKCTGPHPRHRAAMASIRPLDNTALKHEPAESPQSFSAPSVYLWTVSRTIELSLQSSFQLSLTVLVDYRTSVQYLALDGVYHLLWAAISNNPTPRTDQGKFGASVRVLHPLWT